jgi:hypothetical protein
VHPEPVADEGALLIIGLGHDRQEIVEVLFDAVEASAEVVMVVQRDLRRPPGLIEDRELTDETAQFLVSREGWTPSRKTRFLSAA